MIDNFYDIEKSISLLINNFKKINKLGWILKKTSNDGEFGNTLENLLGKTNNDLQIPDFEGIEIKTKTINSLNNYITFFNLSPYGKDFFEIERLKNTYGYPDSTLKQYKVLNGDVFCKTKSKIGAKYKFQTKIDYKKQKINLLIYNTQEKLVDDYIFWPFELLKEKFSCKAKYLALIKVKTKKMNKKTYYKYESMDIYKFISFENFLTAIENNYIKIQFKIGIFKTGKRIGETHNRGTGFQINEKYMTKVYKRICKN